MKSVKMGGVVGWLEGWCGLGKFAVVTFVALG